MHVLGSPGDMSGQDYTGYGTALQGWFLCMDVLGSLGEKFRDRFIDVDLRTSTIHNAQSECGLNAVAGTNHVISGTVRVLREAQRTLRSYDRSQDRR